MCVDPCSKVQGQLSQLSEQLCTWRHGKKWPYLQTLSPRLLGDGGSTWSLADHTELCACTCQECHACVHVEADPDRGHVWTYLGITLSNHPNQQIVQVHPGSTVQKCQDNGMGKQIGNASNDALTIVLAPWEALHIIYVV